MFIEEKDYVKAECNDGNTYTGTVYAICIQNCEDDNNKPHALIFISQDKNYIKEEGEFGCVSLWVEKCKSITLLNKAEKTIH